MALVNNLDVFTKKLKIKMVKVCKKVRVCTSSNSNVGLLTLPLHRSGACLKSLPRFFAIDSRVAQEAGVGAQFSEPLILYLR